MARAWWRRARLGAAITAYTPEGRRFDALGQGSYLAFPQGVLHGIPRIRIGTDCVINEHVVLSAGLPSDHPGPGEPIIVLGHRCVLGRGTEILAVIVDHHHRHNQPEIPVARPWPLTVRPVSIGAGTVISTGAHIGENSIVASGAQVRPGTYPPGSLLAGTPARVVPTGHASTSSGPPAP